MSKENIIHVINLKPKDFSREKKPSGKCSDTEIKCSSTIVKTSKVV